MITKKERLIVALDVETKEKVKILVDSLKNEVGMFKIGLQLYTSMGNEIIRYIKDRECKIFLDLKLHDIPNTVAKSARILTALGIDMFNIHSQGGYEMMRKAKEASIFEANALGIDAPKLIAVTILTSLGDEEVRAIGYHKIAKKMVAHLAKLTEEAGLDGVVCSPLEAGLIREIYGENFLRVTPGVRPLGDVVDDQKRISTPKASLEGGSSYIVIGRPITESEDVVAAARSIVKEMEQAKC